MALPILDGNQTAATLSTVLTGGEHIPAHTVVSLGSQAITDVRSAVSGSVVSISNFPSTQTIAGTVTANVPLVDATLASGVTQGVPVYLAGGRDGVVIDEINYINNIPAISGTVTASLFPQNGTAVQVDGGPNDTVGIRLGYNSQTEFIIVSDTSGLPVQGTVTANNPSGALTTRFGSVTTANTSQLTSCVTNASRKFLLVQNIATSTVTIGIGFAPTTTQGIQLTAGAGLTFDAFCPTGGVWWLSSTTGSNFSILEG